MYGLLVFADADYASKSTDRRSVSGGLIMCGGACVQCFSRTQKCATLSTIEPEYVATAETMKEVLFLQQVWCFKLPGVGTPCVPVFEDNEGAVQIAQNPVTSSNSKHIDVRHHFLRELVANGTISITHVRSAWRHADCLTKGLSVETFQFRCNFVLNMGWV